MTLPGAMCVGAVALEFAAVIDGDAACLQRSWKQLRVGVERVEYAKVVLVSSCRGVCMGWGRLTNVLVRQRGRAEPATSTDSGDAAAGNAPPLAVRAILVQALLVWAASRIVFMLLTYFAQLLTVARPAVAGTSLPVLSFGAWQKLDANWYLDIVAHGYTYVGRSAFFPLYPSLVSLVHALFLGNLLLFSGMLVSNLAALAAIFGLGLLAANEAGAEASAPTMRVFVAYPLALFTFAAYADGLLVACAVFALLFARRGMWFAAAGCAFLAALTRPTGIILTLPLVWEFGQQQGWWRGGWRAVVAMRPVRRWLELAAIVLAVPVAVGGYALFLLWQLGDALAFIHVQAKLWHRGNAFPWQTLALARHAFQASRFWSPRDARLWVDALPLLVIAVVALIGVRKVPFSFTLYMACLLVVSLISPKTDNGIPLAAVGRYLLPAVPVFLLLGRWIRTRPSLDTLIVGGGFALQAVFTVYFLTGGYMI